MNLLLLFCNAHFANILKIKSNAKKYMHKKMSNNIIVY